MSSSVLGGTESRLRSQRRSAGERHALASVERHIRASDPKLRRKYLSDLGVRD